MVHAIHISTRGWAGHLMFRLDSIVRGVDEYMQWETLHAFVRGEAMLFIWCKVILHFLLWSEVEMGLYLRQLPFVFCLVLFLRPPQYLEFSCQLLSNTFFLVSTTTLFSLFHSVYQCWTIASRKPLLVSTVNTTTNSIIGDMLLVYSDFADNAKTIPANEMSFSITIPSDLGDTCSTTGACVV